MEAHHATYFEAIADAIPDAPVLGQGDRIVTYRQMDERTARLAGALKAAGLTTQSKVAIDMFNCLEWLEAYYGSIKGRFVPVSINYRYLDDELMYLFDNSDAEALIFHASLGERVIRVAQRLPRIKALIQVDDIGGAPVPDGVLDYDDIVNNHAPMERIERSGDDITMWFSGGTTGMPKGVILPIARSAESAMSRELRIRTMGRFDAKPEDLPLDVVEGAKLNWEQGGRPVSLPAAPLMHSTALSYCGPAVIYCGGMVVTLQDHHFDSHQLWQTVDKFKVTTITIVGDAFAKPMTRALEEAAADGKPYDGSSLDTIYSAGVVWSAGVKDRLFDFLPRVILVDNCGSSEGAWYGTQVLRKGDPTSSAAFTPAPNILLLDEHDQPIPKDSDQPGLLASVTGMAGYHKDPEKTAQNFRHINGLWYTTPGDLGRYNPDGTITLIGRGSSVINTGGEKVYPEEVDDVVKQLEDVDDCLVVGTPNERFGQQVTAVVQRRKGGTVSEQEIIDYVRTKLAHYKGPRAVVFVEKVPRLQNGKPDYPTTREIAEKAMADRA
ncbi:MAG: AMP-binding protein [Acidimicrobiia bacterium]